MISTTNDYQDLKTTANLVGIQKKEKLKKQNKKTKYTRTEQMALIGPSVRPTRPLGLIQLQTSKKKLHLKKISLKKAEHNKLL